MIQDEIMKLQTYKMFEGDSDIYVERDDVLEVLKQQPCEDCISRQAVLDMQYRIDDSLTLSTRDVVNVDDVEDLPPVTPQPRSEVLDKIRAEIEAKCCITVGRENDGAITLHDVFEIIDKYKESEE